MKEWKIPARLDRLSELLAAVGDTMREAGISGKSQNSVMIAVEEIFVNIASYAYAPGEGDAAVRLSANPKQTVVEFRDGGMPYNPLARPNPDTSLSADEREIGGLGILMVKKLMDHVEYRYEDGMNVLRIEKSHDDAGR